MKIKSFTIIELLLAIIIVGITVISIPLLLNISSNSTNITLQGKTFFNAYSLVTLIQTQEWDENNTKGDNYYKVLTSDNGDIELKCKRKGLILLNNKSGADCANENNKTSSIGIDANEEENNVSTFDDIDDFNNYSTIANDTNITVKVFYIDDNIDYSLKNLYFNSDGNNKVNNSNIKQIELNITKDKKIISILRYFSSNIGKIKIESRSE